LGHLSLMVCATGKKRPFREASVNRHDPSTAGAGPWIEKQFGVRLLSFQFCYFLFYLITFISCRLIGHSILLSYVRRQPELFVSND